LSDYHARFYSVTLGRFTQPDTVIPGATNSQSWNRFAYAYNNPLYYTDPSGHTPIIGDCNFYGYCPDTGTGGGADHETGNSSGDSSGGISDDDLADKLKKQAKEMLYSRDNDMYTDLDIMSLLFKLGMNWSGGNALQTLKILSMMFHKASPLYDAEDNHYFMDDYLMDDSGFGELKDTKSPNQMGHFFGEAYVAFLALETNKALGGIVSNDTMNSLLVFGVINYETSRNQSDEQTRVDATLGILAVGFANTLSNGMNPYEAMDLIVSSIQSWTFGE
jgi:hypothetical protein